MSVEAGPLDGKALDSLRDLCIWVDGEGPTTTVVPRLILRVPVGDDTVESAIIPACEHGGSLVVALPGAAWSRGVVDRVLPRGSLIRPQV